MEKNEGFILLYRCLQDNDFLYDDEHKYTKPEIWIDMLFLARWQDAPRTFTIRGNKVTVKRGEFAESVKALASRWKWSHPSVLKLLREFEEHGMIEIKKSNVISITRILNYDKYQVKNLPQNLPQDLPQKNGGLPQGIPVNSGDMEENVGDGLLQNLPQFLPQNLPQFLPPLNNSINNINISLSKGENEEKFFSDLKRVDAEFFSIACMRLGIDSEIYARLLNNFELECRARQVCHANIGDIRGHFLAWAKIEIEREKKTQNKTRNETSKDKRRGAEVSAKSAGEYNESF